ncbi:MAG: mannose-6-phosphate isomerase, class I [Micropruina sp.]|uniref:mannose-6-phosphate isomerase, class I n=1 Tax=Micropruina sp. TaxID=2737536 RepID=UPI0039E42B90
MFIELTNTPRHYAWGSYDGIAAFTGHPASGEPEAELWFGTHPGSPSLTPRTFPSTNPGHETLRDWVAAEPEALLGSPDATELPILLKVLAARTPLSLQVHPSPEQAEQGYADEVARGIAVDAFSRSYKDPFPKPEIIVAVTEFEALGGFRPVAEVAAFAADLAALAPQPPSPALARLLDLLATPTDVEPIVDWLLSGEPDAVACVAEVIELAGSDAAGRTPSAATFGTVRELAGHYPGDPGVVIAALANRVTLQPGECLFADAGVLHAYLHGVGIELMTASDNVLRGGLTPKHIDTDELLRVLSFDQGPPAVLEPRRPADNVAVYAPPAGFTLTVIDLAAPTEHLGGGPAILLVERGPVTLAGADGSVTLMRGDAVFIPASERDVSVVGPGRVWLAGVGSTAD